MHLRRLLGRAGTTHVSVNVGGITELASAVLDIVPNAAGGGRGTLSADKRVDAGRKLAERRLDVAALGVAGAEESSVNNKQDPGAALEQDSGENNAEPERDFEGRDDRHGRIVVLLDKGPNAFGQRAVGLSAGRRPVSGCGSRHDGGKQVGASVRGDVEDGVDAVREESEGVLGGKEPNQSHHYRRLATNIKDGLFAVSLTEVLDILVREETNSASRHLGARLCAGLLRLVDDNAVGQSRGNERSTVGKDSHSAVVVHAQPREAISDRGQDERQVSIRGAVSQVPGVENQCQIAAIRRGKVLNPRTS